MANDIGDLIKDAYKAGFRKALAMAVLAKFSDIDFADEEWLDERAREYAALNGNHPDDGADA